MLQKNGATVVRIAIFRQGRFDGAWKNHLVGWAEVDLASFFLHLSPSSSTGGLVSPGVGDGGDGGNGEKDTASTSTSSSTSIILEETLDILDPEEQSKILGTVRVSGRVSSFQDLEHQVWQALLPLADFDGNNVLNEAEFTVLLRAFGSDVSDEEVHSLFAQADRDGSGSVDVDELSWFLAVSSFSSISMDDTDTDADTNVDTKQEEEEEEEEEEAEVQEEEEQSRLSLFSRLVRRCPVDGAELSTDPQKQASNLLYVWLALSACRANHESDLKAGYLTESQAAASWMLRLSEWASHPLALTSQRRRKKSYVAGGLRVGSAAAHILVFDRSGRRVVEEALSPVLNIAMRNLYQSKVGRALMRRGGLFKRLQVMSVKEGKYRDSPQSARDIIPFVESFRGQIDVSDAQLPLDQFKTFNEFFYRKLKPGARPIQCPNNDDVIASAADCRLQVFRSVDEATRFWVKGRNFSIAGLLGDTDPALTTSKAFTSTAQGSSMAIFRLAPQDYHRFHTPVTGTIVSITDVPGGLLTVNPIAVNSLYWDVFTVNKRSVMMIDTPNFGRVAFIAIGATLVGSIFWTRGVGERVSKGDELGYFAFGGSTCILLIPGCQVTWDADLQANAHRSLETLVRVGERIGVKVGCGEEQGKEEWEQLLSRTSTLAAEGGALALEERGVGGEEEEEGLQSVVVMEHVSEEEEEDVGGEVGEER